MILLKMNWMLCEFLEELLPEETNQRVYNLHHIRNSLQGQEFKDKVKRLNEITSELLG